MLILRTSGKFLSLWDAHVALSATKFYLLFGTGLVRKKLQVRVRHFEPVSYERFMVYLEAHSFIPQIYTAY